MEINKRKIEQLEKEKEMETLRCNAIQETNEGLNRMLKHIESQNKQLQAVHEVAEELRIITMVNTTESYDYIAIEKTKWDKLQQALTKVKENNNETHYEKGN